MNECEKGVEDPRNGLGAELEMQWAIELIRDVVAGDKVHAGTAATCSTATSATSFPSAATPFSPVTCLSTFLASASFFQFSPSFVSLM